MQCVLDLLSERRYDRAPKGWAVPEEKMPSFWQGKRVTVTGGAGFLGTHLTARLEKAGAKVFVPRRNLHNLVYAEACYRCLTEHPADVVIHAAAYYGGLGINLVEPAKIFYENLVMGANLMEAARLTGVKKFVAVGTACSYPGYLEGALKERDLWAGPLHETVVNYGLTKKLMSIQGAAYKKQYGFDSIHVILTNLYGPGDSYNPDRSHVVAALIRKWVEAQLKNDDSVTCWGTGAAIREFIYVDDAAEGILRAAESYEDAAMPLNIGTGLETSIRELSETIHSVTGFRGKIKWDSSKPDGCPKKVLDVARMREVLDWAPPTRLRDGLARTIAWYRENKEMADKKW